MQEEKIPTRDEIFLQCQQYWMICRLAGCEYWSDFKQKNPEIFDKILNFDIEVVEKHLSFEDQGKIWAEARDGK